MTYEELLKVKDFDTYTRNVARISREEQCPFEVGDIVIVNPLEICSRCHVKSSTVGIPLEIISISSGRRFITVKPIQTTMDQSLKHLEMLSRKTGGTFWTRFIKIGESEK